MIEICNRGDFIKAQTYRSVFVCRSCGQADHPAERRGFEPLKPFRGLLAFQAGQFNHSCTSPTTVPSCDSGDKDRKIIANNLLFEDLFLKFPQKIVLLVSFFHPRRSPLRQYLNNIGQL